MPDPDKALESKESKPDDAARPDVMSPEELKTVHEDATRSAHERADFLKASLGKAMSPSTEYLKDMVVDLVDDIGDWFDGSSDEVATKVKDKGEKKSPEEALKDIKEDPAVKDEREKLEQLADDKIKDPAEKEQFKKDMEEFEKRAAGENPPLKPEDIQKTYEQIARLMETPDGPDVPLKTEDRVKLAEQVMRQAAHPKDISQGQYNTCNATTVETRTYTKNPAEAARMVADVATTGKYTSNGNPKVTVEIDRDSLARHGQSADDVPGDNKRTYASQLFEVTAVNVYYKSRQMQGGDDIRYEQHEPRPAGPGNNPPADNGERLYNYSKIDPKTGKPEEVMDSQNKTVPARNPNLGSQEIAEISRQINPEPELNGDAGPIVIDREPDSQKSADRVLELKSKLYGLDLKSAGIGDGTPPDLSDPEAVKKVMEAIDQREKEGLPAEKAEDLRDRLSVLQKEKAREYRNDKGVVVVHSPEEMEKTLAQLKEAGRLPVIMTVSASREPFRSDGGSHATGDLAGGHVVTVTDYHPAENGKPATVELDNQWGKSADRTVTVKELYDAQEPLKSPVMEKLNDLEKRKVAGEFKGKDTEYDKQMQDLYLEEIQRWQAARGTADEAKEALAVETLKDSLRQLEPAPQRGEKVMQAAIAEFKRKQAAHKP